MTSLENLDEGLAILTHAGITYDDNLFRVANEEEARLRLGTSDRADAVLGYGVGVNYKLPVSRQKISLSTNIARNDYQRFDTLDHTAGDAALSWDWGIGELWDGTLGYRFTRSLSRFNELQRIVPDIRNRHSVRATARFPLHPQWRIASGGRWFTLKHDARPRLDRREATTFAELQYLGVTGSHFGLRGQYTRGDLDNDQVFNGNRIRNDFDETEISLVSNWQATAKSTVEGRLGFTRRDRDDPAADDFSGTTANLRYDWEVTTKTNLSFSLRRNVNSLDGQIRGFVVTKAAEATVTWEITPKIQASGDVYYAENDFRGDGISQQGNRPNREDEVTAFSLSLEYLPWDNVGIAIEYQNANRDSNRPLSEFDTNRISATIGTGFQF